MKFKSLGEMAVKNCKDFASKTVYMYKKDGEYHSVTYGEFFKLVTNTASGLMAEGLKRGDKVVLLSENRLEWAVVDYACQISGLVSVPIYATLLEQQVEYIVNDCEAKVVCMSNEYQTEKVISIRKNLKKVKHYYQFDASSNLPDGVEPFGQLMSKGEEYVKENPDWYLKTVEDTNEDDLATIIYTSGTTGEPKGAMLTHKNFLSNIEGGLDALSVSSDDIFLSFLPLSHVFERMAGHYLAFYRGATIAYAESIDTVADNLQEVKPTIMTSVPRFYEKIYTKINEGIRAGSPVKRMIFNWSLKQGKKVFLHKTAKKPVPGMLQKKFNIAKKLVFDKLRDRVGGRIRFFVSGGAPLAKEIGEFFAFANLLILEGYGLTETSPVITVNREEAFKFGTVGLPLFNVEVKIAEDGEILAKGPNIMKGYFKKEAETKEVIDEDGWFHTGDIGFFDKDGFLVITDRKKNIIVTSGGKNIAPQPIENVLITSRYIEQAVVVGNKRKYCTALIVPNMDALINYARDNYVEYQTDEELLNQTMIKDVIRTEIDKLSTNLASYETIKEFTLLAKPFTLEDGELTPTLKIKRNVIEEKYKDIIDKMYPLV